LSTLVNILENWYTNFLALEGKWFEDEILTATNII
jgi:hypothetical protein